VLMLLPAAHWVSSIATFGNGTPAVRLCGYDSRPIADWMPHFCLHNNNHAAHVRHCLGLGHNEGQVS